ncbi:MAG: hypothetical protein OWU84_06735 [Firmicutes bacterium]|nr:hypothetical protein [Bacillota bacterium]
MIRSVTLVYSVLLLLVYAGPALLTLSPVTYHATTAAHFVTFLASVVLFVLLGKHLKARRRRRARHGFVVGLAVAWLGTGIAEYIRRLPLAQQVFIQELPGVPRAAALTMLHLHAVTGAVLSALLYGALYALLGAFAAWWGGRDRLESTPTPPDSPHPVT